MKSLILWSLAFCMGVLGPISCTKKSDTGHETASGTEKLRVAVLLAPSGKGDKSYNDMALSGVKQVPNSVSVEVVEILPNSTAEYPVAISRVVEDQVDLVIAVGFLYADAVAVAGKAYPKLRFLLIDAAPTEESDNVRSVVFKPEEGSLLVGAIAAELTESGKVGFVAGMDIPIMNRFRCGFVQGVDLRARSLGKRVAVVTRYVGSTADAFSNPAKGKDIAEALFDDGIDIIYHASGASGNGIIQAAQNRGKMVIGVDTDQSYLAPGSVVTSMRKRIDRAVAEAITDIALGRFTGGTVVMGVANGGVDYVRPTADSPVARRTVNYEFIDRLRDAIAVSKLQVCP